MTTVSEKDLLAPEDVCGLLLSKYLTEFDISNSISEEDENLIFINYDGVEFDNESMNPLLSIYLDQDSKFAHFSLINAAPEAINKKTIGSFINALNKNYLLARYEESESDGNFYITCEYWLNYKFGLNPLAVHHLIYTLPSVFGGALHIESTNL